MLISEPTRSDPKALDRWRVTRRVPTDRFREVWAVLNTIEIFPDSPYEEWESGSYKYMGQRTHDGKENGIVRYVYENGTIFEASFNNGK